MTQALADLPLFSQAEKERAERDRILDTFEWTRADYLKAIRRRMEGLWAARADEVGRENATVSPDDARAYFESLDPPGPDELNRSFLAAVFRPACWEHVGFTFSTTDGSHRNRLNTYRMRTDT